MNEILPILLPTLLLGSIFSAVAGSGLGIILLIVFTLFFDIQMSVVLMVLIGFIIQPIKVLHFYKYADWRFVKLYALLGFPLSYFGGLLLFDLPLRTIEIFMALTCLAFVLMQVSKWKFELEKSTTNIVIWGAINGFQGGVVGLGNFLRNPVMYAFGFRKEQFVGTASTVTILLNIGKMTAYIPNVVWTKEIGIMFLSCIPPVYIGITIGKKLQKHISDHTFEKLLLLVIVAGVIKLLFFA